MPTEPLTLVVALGVGCTTLAGVVAALFWQYVKVRDRYETRTETLFTQFVSTATALGDQARQLNDVSQRLLDAVLALPRHP